jgi:hypothetical protein
VYCSRKNSNEKCRKRNKLVSRVGVVVVMKKMVVYKGSFTLAKFSAKLFVKVCATETATICLGHLERCDTNRIGPICVTSLKAAKVSSRCCCRKLFHAWFCRKLCQCKYHLRIFFLIFIFHFSGLSPTMSWVCTIKTFTAVNYTSAQ